MVPRGVTGSGVCFVIPGRSQIASAGSPKLAPVTGCRSTRCKCFGSAQVSPGKVGTLTTMLRVDPKQAAANHTVSQLIGSFDLAFMDKLGILVLSCATGHP